MTTVKAFCSLSTYIKQRSPDFHEIIFHKLCLSSMLRPQKGNKPLTFLFPDEAYIKRFMKEATDIDPTEVVAMLNALIFDANVSSLSNAPSKMRNRNGHVFTTEFKNSKLILDGSHEVFTPKKDMYVHWHPNPKIKENPRIFVYDVQIKGDKFGEVKSSSGNAMNDEIEGGWMRRGRGYRSFNGGGDYDDVPTTNTTNYRSQILQFLKEGYIADRGNNNIFFKKVCVQLRILRANKNSDDVALYLGNDEITDSFLLDLLMDENTWNELYACMVDNSTTFQEFNKLDINDYWQIRDDVIKSGNFTNEYVDQQVILRKIQAPVQYFQMLQSEYKDKEKLSRDIFIMFTTLCKELWTSEFASSSSSETFESYWNIVTNLNPNLNTFVQDTPPSSIEYQCSVYGNLLKSDAFMHRPKPQKLDTSCFSHVDEIPAPNDTKLFSATYIARNLTQKSTSSISGGSSWIAEARQKYL